MISKFNGYHCNGTTPNRCLHHYSFQETLVILWHYLDICTICIPVVPRHEKKVSNTQNTVCFLFDTKFICHHLFLVVADKRETEYKNNSTDLDRNNLLQDNRGKHRPWYYSLWPVWNSFMVFTQNGCSNLRNNLLIKQLTSVPNHITSSWEMELVTGVQILDKAVCFTNVLWKGIFSSFSYG